MSSIKLPEFYLQYFSLKVFHVLHPEDVYGKTFTVIIAPDSYVALGLFTALCPDTSSTGVVFIDDCISVFPQSF